MPHLSHWSRSVRLAFWRAFEHDAFAVAKGAAYSSILSIFPVLLVVASVLAYSHHTQQYVGEIADAVGKILPPGTSYTTQIYFQKAQQRPAGVLITTSLLTLWTASGVVISWMDGFRRAYALPKTWGVVKERLIAFALVILAGIPLTFATLLVAFGNQIERWMMYRAGHEFGPYILLVWLSLRWLIAILTSVAVIALIYHNAVPRTQPWHSVLPGAVLATVLWFSATMLFGWYVSNYAEYSLIYGALAAAIVLLVWLFIISVIVLVGAEYNALLFPRCAAADRAESKVAVA